MRNLLLSLSLPALILAAPLAQAAEKLPLSAISAYLNGLKTAESPFTQINDDGTLTTGTLYLSRPGKARFQYDPPGNAAVIVGAGTVVIRDPKSNQPPESYPLSRTPLSIILASRVDLDRANMVVGHTFDGTSTVITAQDPDNPDYGRIELMFTDTPVELRKWVIHDASGGQTTVILGKLETGMSLPGSLFLPVGGSAPTDKR
ncbi:LolA family protein [Pseudodonghicola flavimaris]|uniref:Outer membrane lipoprotein carrier protein LolA n=1 Tax=Pseudodonghicola flavimaris TaxID=3050036 RepID=A0ABT7F5M8_9RHOB|nr:outer membrane lipoprotein carrier protein LolA [Pseudodonghicola flavimaris]MDK3019914.1 outer membrane lipoprotein carrier protein LolA [Pseudodonghicola flavimaris]